MEGGLQKPERYDIDWKNTDYYDEKLFENEFVMRRGRAYIYA